MTLPREVVLTVLSRGLTPEQAADKLEEYTRIRERVAANKRKSQDMIADTNAAVKALLDSVKCPHEVTCSHGDPSGNGDTAYECLVCGEWVYDKQVRYT